MGDGLIHVRRPDTVYPIRSSAWALPLKFDGGGYRAVGKRSASPL